MRASIEFRSDQLTPFGLMYILIFFLLICYGVSICTVVAQTTHELADLLDLLLQYLIFIIFIFRILTFNSLYLCVRILSHLKLRTGKVCVFCVLLPINFLCRSRTDYYRSPWYRDRFNVCLRL